MSETSLFRRDPRGRREDARHTFRVAALMLAAALVVMNAGNWVFRRVWIDLQSVTVADHAVGDDARVEAWRVIHNDFWGAFSVTIREAGTERFICTTGLADPFEYRAAASAVQPYVTTLSGWLGGADQVAECVTRGFGVGVFFLTTCHHHAVAGLIPARRCVDSAPFERTEE